MNRKEWRDNKNANHRRNEQRRFDRRCGVSFNFVPYETVVVKPEIVKLERGTIPVRAFWLGQGCSYAEAKQLESRLFRKSLSIDGRRQDVTAFTITSELTPSDDSDVSAEEDSEIRAFHRENAKRDEDESIELTLHGFPEIVRLDGCEH